MKHVIGTATDVANVCFFDPAGLPADFQEQVQTLGYEYFKKLEKAGKIWSLDTGSDGQYPFHFYVEEGIPDRIIKYSMEPRGIEQFQVPGGTIWACGAEFAALDPIKAGLGKYSHMGGSLVLPAGVYRVQVL